MHLVEETNPFVVSAKCLLMVPGIEYKCMWPRRCQRGWAVFIITFATLLGSRRNGNIKAIEK